MSSQIFSNHLLMSRFTHIEARQELKSISRKFFTTFYVMMALQDDKSYLLAWKCSFLVLGLGSRHSSRLASKFEYLS